MRPVRILLVEDNPADVQLIRLGLQAKPEFQFELFVVEDGDQALDFLHRREGWEKAAVPDLILLD
ncbi:MAG TPA: response regulator, partial [Bryobacteraceae bacterium]|nr:response regulator [Bryobacteraceae bacterium]